DFPQDVRLCVARALMHGQSMRHCVIEPEARFQSRHRVLTDYFAVLKQQFDFSVATSAHAMCDVEECHANRGETLLIVDNNHLSEAGALYVMSYLDIPLLSLPATSKDKDPASPLKKFGGKARTMQVVEAPH
ncbi:MAG TPA: SGNH hydrolase domain-containing protein, partial [Hyphomicrobiales bacterium]|nr:SGNH hydrolase domain-containing protein [Hyphomicrobiales bacterium]